MPIFLKKGDSTWYSVSDELNCIIENKIENGDEKPYFFKTNTIPANTVPIGRKDAELLENIWNSTDIINS